MDSSRPCCRSGCCSAPRGYLSSFTKIGTIFLLAAGVIIVNPQLQMPALTQFASGGGPIIPGPLFPFCFVTIACGAISGFHSLISSGTTSKMIDKESDIRPIGYGAMLIEGVVGIMALIAATAMPPGDYFAINVPQAAYSQMTFQGAPVHHVDLETIEAAVGETVEGRTGGAVSLAVGMAMIFSSLPGMKGLLAYWYHFAIMFEALFILTTIDSGTRVGRFLLQEAMGKIYRPLAQPNWLPGAAISTALLVLAWGYFIYTGNISYDLADVRRRQSAAWLRGTRGRDDDPDQHGEGQIHVGDDRAAHLPRREHVLRRLPQHSRQFLAAGAGIESGLARARLCPLDLHGHHAGPGRHHPGVGDRQVGQRAFEPAAYRPGGGLIFCYPEAACPSRRRRSPKRRGCPRPADQPVISGVETVSAMRSSVCRVICGGAVAVAVLGWGRVADAQYRPASEIAIGEKYHVEGAIAFWNADPDLTVSSEALGIRGDDIDLVKDLGIEQKKLRTFSLVLRPATKHKFRFEYLPLKYESEALVPREFVFNGLRYRVGLPVNTSADLTTYRFGYEYDFLYFPRGYVGALVDLKYTDVDVTLTSPVGTGFTREVAPIPGAGIAGRGYLAKNVSVTGEVSYFRIPQSLGRDEWGGRYLEYDFYGTVNFSQNVGAQLGLRSIHAEYFEDLDAGDLRFRGWYFGGVFRY